MNNNTISHIKNISKYSSKESLLQVIANLEGFFALYELVNDQDGHPIDLRILLTSDNYLKIIGKKSEDVIGKVFSAVVPEGKAWIPFYANVALGGKTQAFESYIERFKMYHHTLVFSPAHGQVAVIIIDRTQFVLSEGEINEKEQKAAALFSAMPEGMCFFKLIFNEKNEPIDIYYDIINQAYELYEGYIVGSLQGKRLYETYPTATKAHLEIYADAIRKNKKLVFTKHVEHTGKILEVICFPQPKNYMISVERDVTEKVKAENELKEAYFKINQQNQTILDSINYASKIQRNLLTRHTAFEAAFSDYSVTWNPRDIVGGDIFWLKNFDDGTLLCVCDCTGHGTPGALLTMVVVSTFETTVNETNHNDPAAIIWELEKRLVSLFNVKTESTPLNKRGAEINDGCDIAVLFINKKGEVKISAGNTHVFVCDGKKVTKYPGQKIRVGDGTLPDKDGILVTTLPANPDNKFYIASDGLYDQLGGPKQVPFGYGQFKKIILENHHEKQSVISEKIWLAFEEYRGQEPRVDDFELITFKP